MAVRTGGKGAAGISLIAVPGDAPGLTRTPLDEDGLVVLRHGAAALRRLRVPADHLIGEEGAGFRTIMANFNGERLLMSAGACAFAQVCFDEALDWARQRQTFGAPLVEHQVIRHKLVDMQMRIEAHARLAARAGRASGGRATPTPSGSPSCAC